MPERPIRKGDHVLVNRNGVSASATANGAVNEDGSLDVKFGDARLRQEPQPPVQSRDVWLAGPDPGRAGNDPAGPAPTES